MIGFLCNRVRLGNRAGAVGLFTACCCKFRPDPFGRSAALREITLKRAAQIRTDWDRARRPEATFQKARRQRHARTNPAAVPDVANSQSENLRNTKPEEQLRRNERTVARVDAPDLADEVAFFGGSEGT